MNQDINMAKTYSPKDFEDRLYKKWIDKGYFKAKTNPEKEPFTIVIPPPNITGQLHMGHALNNTIQDIIIRHKRMQGYETLWLPGTDHASIATEVKIVEEMKREGITKEDLGREKFLERAWEWKFRYGSRIVEQLKKLGSSCDWDRERFTMDEGLSEAVKQVFIKLYNKGLIYRGERIINWCPDCVTSISDAEVEHEEKEGNFWHIKYPIKDSQEYVVIATTRPETMLGDTAVAVNPKDERYKKIVGKKLILPLIDREIPVIADNYVEKDFGTGCVKITPAHDPNDFEVGKRHNLPLIIVMDDKAVMNDEAGHFKGMTRYEARKKIIQELDEKGLLVKIEPHTHNVGTCYRCSTVVEPMASKQWFVKMAPLAKPAIDVVKDGRLKFITERFEKQYIHWMENIHDWCISRQLWWGHRIPGYFCQECNHLMVEATTPKYCSKCESKNIKQDEDTLDTWFSSALWPFSTLGWPEQTEDLKYFYPTSVLVTGYDIIPFWVSRMIFSGMELMNKEPFKHVFIHGIVRDSEGRKMSKSLGNGIDPLEVIDQYGTDALRFSLIVGNSIGNDLRYTNEKVESSRNFANKVWNASRFVLMNFEEGVSFENVDKNKFAIEDKWILSSLNSLIAETNDNLDKYDLGNAIQRIYEFIWEEYCDWYIELVKPRLYDENCDNRLEAQYVLNHVLSQALKLLHPFMPFITEEIYTHLIHSDESIMISKWPQYSENLNYAEDKRNMELIMQSIKSIRNIRSEMNVPNSRKAKIIFVVEQNVLVDIFEKGRMFFEKLVSASDVVIQSNKNGISKNAFTAVVEGAEIFIPLEELIDLDKELERLSKEKINLEAELKRVKEKLSNDKFVDKAPQKLVDEEKNKEAKYQLMYEQLIERIESLKN